MRMKATKESSSVPIASLELPPSMHAVHRLSQRDRKDADMVCSPVSIFSWILNGTIMLCFCVRALHVDTCTCNNILLDLYSVFLC